MIIFRVLLMIYQYFVGFNVDAVDDDSGYDDDDDTKYTNIEQNGVTFVRQ